MLIVIKAGYVIAVHSDNQDISTAQYPGCTIVPWSGATPALDPTNPTPDPRSAAQQQAATAWLAQLQAAIAADVTNWATIQAAITAGQAYVASINPASITTLAQAITVLIQLKQVDTTLATQWFPWIANKLQRMDYLLQQFTGQTGL